MFFRVSINFQRKMRLFSSRRKYIFTFQCSVFDEFVTFQCLTFKVTFFKTFPISWNLKKINQVRGSQPLVDIFLKYN
jgi:hypothetical protein